MTDDGQSSKNKRTLGWVLFALVLLAGFGVTAAIVSPEGTGSATRGAGGVDTPERDRAIGPVSDEPVDIDLSGTWAHKSVQTSLSDVPMGGEVEAKTITHRVTEIEQDGRTIDVRADVCNSKIESSFEKIQTKIPAAFVDAIPIDERSGRLEPAGEQEKLVVERSCGVRGAEVDDPATSALPTSPDDESVRDEDGDGHPGVTVEVEGMVSGEVYIVQRGCDSYRGRVLSRDHIRGTVDWSTDQEMLDSTSMFLRGKPPSRQHPDDEKSWFEMVRIDEGTSCAELMRDPSKYF